MMTSHRRLFPSLKNPDGSVVVFNELMFFKGSPLEVPFTSCAPTFGSSAGVSQSVI